MRLNVSGKTDIGRRRQINQDSFLIDANNRLFVVADGMGGHKGGEVASKLACEVIQNEIINAHTQVEIKEPEKILYRAFQEATRIIHLEANKPGAEELQGMGTTAVALYIHNKKVYLANVGDSRAYLFKSGKLWRITEDHSVVNEQVRAGIISEEDLEKVTGKNVITRSIGFAPEVNVDLFSRPLAPGEKFLLCSDGLHGMVEDEWLQHYLLTKSTDRFIDDSILEANNRGGDDNLTCLFIEVE